MHKPDPEPTPIPRPRRPKCQMRMLSFGVEDRPGGFEDRTFECLKCGHVETMRLSADAFKTGGADGWLSGELGKPH
jgi:hypothetical protein